MVRNHCLASSINDVSWSQFRGWVEYFGKVFGVATVAVPPHNTSQQCSSCGAIVKKSLSTRTHTCYCGTELDRDYNAALNILRIGLSTVGHTGINVWGEDDLYLSSGNEAQANQLIEPENSSCEVGITALDGR